MTNNSTRFQSCVVAAAVLGIMLFNFHLVAAASGRTSFGSHAKISLFTEPQAGDRPVLSLIASARHSIRLEVYELTDSDIVSALAAAKHRHVDVRVLLEQHPYGGGSYASAAYNELRSDGISVRWANENAFTYTHEKSMDVDGSVAGIFTFNLSYSAFDSNREFGVIDHSSRDANQIGSIFQSDWNRKSANLTDHQLVVSPINSRSAITHLIDSAHHTLDLYEEEMEDGSIESHLVGAVHRKVRVRLITSDDSSGVDQIRSSGVHVVIMASPYVHAKAVVADGSRVFIGSENISSTSLDNNREMGIIFSDRAAAKSVENTFQSDWVGNGGGRPPRHGGKLSLSVTTNPNSVKQGQSLTVTAKSTPSASCTIKVTYPDGYVSHASELQGAKTVGTSGRIDWSWHVGSTVTGTAHAAVTCDLGRKGATKVVAFRISR